MMGENMTQSWERTEELINDYLDGQLDEAERESFERRMFAEPDLSLEVERAAELKAALKDRSVAPGRAGMRWVPLAAAAAAAMVAVGLWLGLPGSDIGDTPRGGSTALVVEIDDQLSVRWQEVPAAVSYELRVYLEDGTVIYEQALPGDSTGHRLALDASVEGQKLLRVRALDSFRNVQADSGLVPLPED